MKNYRKKNTLLLVILLVLTFSMIFISILFPENILVNDSFDHGSGYWSNWLLKKSIQLDFFIFFRGNKYIDV
jgi:hypothetical protein